MRNRLLPLAALSLALPGVTLLSAGCEPQADGGDPDLEQAIELIHLASEGYVPANRTDAFDALDVEGFRQAALQEALSHLESAARRGEPEQRVAAQQMMADIHASAARSAARRANTAYSELVTTAGMTAQLRIVSQAHLRLRLFDRDRSVVRRELEREVERQRGDRDRLRSLASELEEEIAALVEERDGHREQASEARAKHHELREQAFLLEGDEYYDLLDEATRAERRAAAAEVEAERVDVQLERRRSELVAVESELAGIESVLADVATQLEKWEQREAVHSDELDRVQPEHQAAAEELVARFDRATQRYDERVREPFLAADEHITEAIDRLESLVSQASGSQRHEVQQDLLAKRVAKVHLLSDHVIAAGGFAHTLGILARQAPRVMPEAFDADVFARARDRVAAQQREVAEATESAVQVARTLASELGNVNDQQLQRFSDRQRAILARYQETVRRHALDLE